VVLEKGEETDYLVLEEEEEEEEDEDNKDWGRNKGRREVRESIKL
jgi:hypothetical protein